MTKKKSAGILPYRTAGSSVEVLIGHPGGPFWAKKDEGAWSIIKGEFEDGENAWEVAVREFREEVGKDIPEGVEPTLLGEIKQPSGKYVTTYSVEADLDLTGAISNTFELEWPRGSGKIQQFPEIDKVDWFTVAEARTKLLKGQVPFLDILMKEAGLENVGEGSSQHAPIQEELF